MDIHLGQAILKKLTEKGMTKREFGRRINKANTTVHHIFTRKSIDTDLLWDISKVLEYNFFQAFAKSSQLGHLEKDESKEKIDKLMKENQLLKKYLKDFTKAISSPKKKTVKKRK
ncbi:MAG: hypothetical protein ACJ77K_17660 [Bacteroidia bacterium]|jgi:hypothetical protein